MATTLYRNAGIVLFLTLTAAVAEFGGVHEAIFPEAGALCVGLWLMPKAVWNVRLRQVPLWLTAAAVIGLFINLLLPSVCFEVRYALAFCSVAIMLRIVRCNMYPVISAAMLPVLTGTTSWEYPACVLVISLLLAVGRIWFPQTDRTEYQSFSLLHWGKLTAALCVFLAFVGVMKSINADFYTLNYLMVPPLVVTMIEFANRKSGFRQRPFTILGLIFAAAVIGTAAEYLHRVLGVLPMTLGTMLSVVIMLLLFHRFKPFAPALAIVMVPMLLPTSVLLWFPLLVTLGSLWFIGVGIFCPTAIVTNGTPIHGAEAANVKSQ